MSAPNRYYRAVCATIAALYYRRVDVLHRERIPARGPALYVALHRNGAIDGVLYERVFRRAAFLVSTQLTRSLLGRLFFTGIPVTRAKDAGDRGGNREAIARCVAELVHGGELAVFPEGTSDLGPRHLPFKPGAARILEGALAAGAPVSVIPAGIFYIAPERIGSDVVVVIGEAVDTTLDPALDAGARVRALEHRIAAALEALGVNVADAAALRRIERLARVRAGEDASTYHRALVHLQRVRLPAEIAESWCAVERAIERGALATEWDAPVFSARGPLWSAGWLLVQAPVVAAAMACNALPLAGALVAGRRLADARNTIALWRSLVGLPLLALWVGALIVYAVVARAWWIPLAWLAITALGLRLWPELLARRARLLNHRERARALRPALERVRDWLRAEIPDA